MKEAAGGGYGIVYREIMRDPSIPPESKAIYAYLCSFAGSDGTCFPKVETMQKELCMGKQRFNKYMSVLVNLGVVVRKREKVGNLVGHNVYKITHRVDFS
jgi:hypothetical protein